MYIKLDFPENQKGKWSLQSFRQNGIKYQNLLKDNILMMSNTPDILANYIDFLERAKGSILINGLGIGMCNFYLLRKENVTDITVIEFDKELIELISPNFENDSRCNIIHDDAFTYHPPKGKKYDFVWHDIWTMKSSRNLKEIDILFKKYHKIADWQGAWAQEDCVKMNKKEIAHREKIKAEMVS